MTTWIGSPLIFVGKYTILKYYNNEKVNFSIGTMFGTSGYYLNESFAGFGGLHWGTKFSLMEIGKTILAFQQVTDILKGVV